MSATEGVHYFIYPIMPTNPEQHLKWAHESFCKQVSTSPHSLLILHKVHPVPVKKGPPFKTGSENHHSYMRMSGGECARGRHLGSGLLSMVQDQGHSLSVSVSCSARAAECSTSVPWQHDPHWISPEVPGLPVPHT